MKKLAKNHTYEFLKATYLIRFLGDAFFYTFLYVFLSSIGFSTGELGLVSALSPTAALIGSVIFQRVAKNLDINRVLMVIFGICEMIVALIFGIFTNQPHIFYIVIIAITSFLNGPYYSLLDGYSGTYISERKKQYSSMRIMGTISYVIGPLLGGLLVEHTTVGYPALFITSSFFFFLTVLLTYFLPKQSIEVHTDVPPEEKTGIKLRLHPELMIYLVFGFIVMALSIVSDNFFGVYLTDVLGVPDAHYGYLIAAAITLETIVFIFIIFKKNMFQNPTFSYFFMGSMVLVRPLVVALNLPLGWTYALSLLRGVAWGYFIVFNVKFLARIIPLKHLTKALFTVSIAMTLGRIIASLTIGEVLQTASYQVVFAWITGLMAFGTVLSMILSEIQKGKEKRAALITAPSQETNK